MNLLLEQVADGLAKRGYAVVDRFLAHSEVTTILELDEFKGGLLHFRRAGTGMGTQRRINENIRGDYVRWIDHHHASLPLQIYFDRLKAMMSFLNENLFLSLKDFEVHLTIYPPGSFYQRHLDQFKRDDHRRLSVILYLNETWSEKDGGQLRLHLPDGTSDILPVAGRMVCFRSDLVEHEVLPAVKDRLSITGWLLDRVNQ